MLLTERGLLPEPPLPPRKRFVQAGKKVILRILESADLDRCYAWLNDPEIHRTLMARYVLPTVTDEKWQERINTPSSTERHLAIERRDDRVHIGNCSLAQIDWVSRSAYFELFIGEPSCWNSGFGTDAIQTLVRYAFDELNLFKLKILIFDYNERAKHLLANAGFAAEGLLRREFFREGKYHDVVLMAIHRE